MKTLTYLKAGAAALCLTVAIAAPVIAGTSDDSKDCAVVANLARAMASDRDAGASEEQELHALATEGLGEDIQHAARMMADRVFSDWDSMAPADIERQIYHNCMQP